MILRNRHRRHRALLTSLVVACLCLQSAIVRAQPATLTKEYKIKAAYLLNMTLYIEWPKKKFSDNDEKITLCIERDQSFLPFIQAVQASRKQGEKTRGVNIVALNADSAATDCDIFYMRHKRSKELAAQCRCVKIGDNPDYRKFGTAINFFTEKKRVRFEANVKQLNRHGVKLSSELLKLARVIVE